MGGRRDEGYDFVERVRGGRGISSRERGISS